MLASSFIFGGKGFIRSQKTNIKDEYRHIFFKFSKQCGLSPVAWLTTFNTGNYVRITSRQSGRNDLLNKSHRRSLLSPSPSFPPSDFFSLSSFAPHSTIRTPGIGYVSASKANDQVSVTFLSPHFRSSLFPFFYFFFNPCPRSHDQCFRNFAFATYQGE